MGVLDLFTDKDIERFWSKVDKTAGHGPRGTCWMWKGKPAANGYGYIGVGGRKGRNIQAHVVAYEIAKGPVPDGLQVDHVCRYRRCVNPDDLEAVTQRVNLLRGDTITHRNATATHCIRGHPFDEGNTYIAKSGSRQCKTCHRLWKRVHRGKEPR